MAALWRMLLFWGYSMFCASRGIIAFPENIVLLDEEQYRGPPLIRKKIEKSSGREALSYKFDRFERIPEEDSFIKRLLFDHTSDMDFQVDALIAETFRDSNEPIKHMPGLCTNIIKDAQTMREIWRDFKLMTQDDSPRCKLCTFLIGLLRTLVCNVSHQRAVDICIRICEVVLENTNSHQGMCNGTVTIQAPYMFTTLKESTPYDFCESLNRCIPPLAEVKMSVPQRIDSILASRDNTRNHQRTITKQRSKENEIKIAQITDIHVSPRYATGSAIDCNMYVCCLEEYDGEGEARMYGEYACNTPERTVHHFLDEVEKLDPDIIIFSGDVPPHIIWDETLDSQLNCTKILVSALQDRFPDKAIYPCIGNHEMYPTNVYSNRAPSTVLMNDDFTELWKDLAGFGSEQEATMRHLGYYSMPVSNVPGLRILAINTNHYWYTLNFMCTINRNTSDEDIHRQFIVDTLTQARASNEKVILVSHHPVGGSDHIVRVSRWWENLVLEYSDVILIHISGHTHKDEFHLYLHPVTSEAKAVNLVATSATSKTNVNPSLKLFYLDSSTLGVQNIESYYMHIDDQKPDKPPPMKKTYDAAKDYGMSNFTPESWKDFSIRLLEDDELFQTWYDNKFGKSMLSTCSQDCKIYEICRMWFPNYDEVEQCEEAMKTITPPTAPTTMETGRATSLSYPMHVSIIAAVLMLFCQ